MIGRATVSGQLRCEVCGRRVTLSRRGELAVSGGWSIHHRVNFGMGGMPPKAAARLQVPSLLLLVCGNGADDSCHGRITANRPSYQSLLDDGLVVSRGHRSPATVAVRLAGERWVVLDDRGGATPR